MSTILIFDNGGLYPYIAEKMVGGFDRVLYHTPGVGDGFPVSRKVLWGQGLEGVERCNHFFDALEGADVICFPDIGSGDLQMYLRAHGHHVWGCGLSEILEQDRIGMLRLLQAEKQPHAEFDIAHGIDHLKEILQQQDDRYVKLGLFRGEHETRHHIDWFRSQNWVSDLQHRLGPYADHAEFIVEEKIEGVEVGYDCFTLDGAFPSVAMYGYERKGLAYCGHVVSYEQVPQVLRDVNEFLSEPLQRLSCRGWFSTEVRVRSNGEGVLIDPCARAPAPPSGSELEAFSNWPAIVEQGAMGVMVGPQRVAPYTAELVLSSTWAKQHALSLRFPESHRKWIKLHYHAIIDGVDWVLGPPDTDAVGYAVGIGNTLKDAQQHATEVAESIEADQLDFDHAAFDELEETIAEGVGSGVSWG